MNTYFGTAISPWRAHHVAGLCLLHEILPAGEIVQGILPHRVHVGDVQVAVVEDHVNVVVKTALGVRE